MAPVTSPTLTVATYNIRRDSFLDGRDAWYFRRDWVREILRKNRFDIVGVQEAKANQVDFLRSDGWDYVGVGRDDGARGGEFSPIFYNRARFRRHTFGTFWLSPTPDMVSRGWDAANNRVCTWVCLEDTAAGAGKGQRFFVFNTHLDNKGTVARERSVGLILQRIRAIAKDAPFFLVGDFNLRPGSPPIKRLSTTLRNARLVTETPPMGPNGTANGFDVNRPLDTRIDYLFVSPTVRVHSYAVLREVRNGRYASDHFPVVIRASLKTPSGTKAGPARKASP